MARAHSREPAVDVSVAADVARSIGLRPLVRWLRPRLARALHPWRRRAARSAVAAAHPVRRILVLCTGNICRSPFAERYLRARLPSSVRVGSSGFLGPDRPCPPEALAEARGRGIDLDDHRSRLTTLDELRRADLVVAMAAEHALRLEQEFPGSEPPLVLLGDFDPAFEGARDVADPWGQPPEAFATCFDRLERCLDELVASVTDAGADARAARVRPLSATGRTGE